MPDSLRDEIAEILELQPDGRTVSNIFEAIKKRLPEHKPAHTYASENADEYYAYDKGFKDCLNQMKLILEKP